MMPVSTFAFFTLICFTVGEWMQSPESKNVPIESIIEELEDISFITCELKCENSPHCSAIGTRERPSLGKEQACFHLKDHGDAEGQKPTIELFVWKKMTLPPMVIQRPVLVCTKKPDYRKANLVWKKYSNGGKYCNDPADKTRSWLDTAEKCKNFCEINHRRYCMWNSELKSCKANNACKDKKWEIVGGWRKISFTAWKRQDWTMMVTGVGGCKTSKNDMGHVKPFTDEACQEFCVEKGRRYCMFDYGRNSGFCMASDYCPEYNPVAVSGPGRGATFKIWKRKVRNISLRKRASTSLTPSNVLFDGDENGAAEECGPDVHGSRVVVNLEKEAVIEKIQLWCDKFGDNKIKDIQAYVSGKTCKEFDETANNCSDAKFYILGCGGKPLKGEKVDIFVTKDPQSACIKCTEIQVLGYYT